MVAALTDYARLHYTNCGDHTFERDAQKPK